MDGFNVAGEATITVRDAETLEIVSERTVKNNITVGGLHTLSTGAYASGLMQVIIYEGVLGDTDMLFRPTDAGTAVWIPPSSTLQNFTTHIDASPSYYETVFRYNQPTSTRTIRNIMVTKESTNIIFTKVALDPPCTQTTTQILDITYRIFYSDSTNPSIMRTAPRTGIHHMVYATSSTPTNTGRTIYPGYKNPHYAYPTWHKPPIDVYDDLGRRSGTDFGFNVASSRWDSRTRSVGFSESFVQADAVGQVISGIVHSEAVGSTPASTVDILGAHAIVPVGNALQLFTNAPIQPLHNHASTAVAPFLDVNHLPAGSGTPSLDGSAWTNPDYPKYIRLDITSTGDVGTANYSLRHRNNVGFNGNGYYSRYEAIGFVNDDYSLHSNPSIQNGHGLSVLRTENMVQWDGRTIVLGDISGVTLVDIISGKHANFDANSTPALPISNRRQMVTDANKNVWVADTAAGLFKVTDPMGTPTITHMSNATNGIPVNGDVSCLAVGLGSNNKVWAVFDGGLSSSDDGGATWTNYDESSPHPFAFVGLTDVDWTLVKSIVVDQESENGELAVLYTLNSDEHRVVWWSEVDTTATGPIHGNVHKMKCSRTGGMWVGGDSFTESSLLDLTRSKIQLFTYGTTSLTNFGADVWHDMQTKLPAFVYDYYKTPYVLAANTTTGSSFHSMGLFDIRRKFIADLYRFTAHSTVNRQGIGLMFEDENGLGKGLYQFHHNYTQKGPTSIQNICPQTGHGTLNYQHSVYEEIVWDKYQWNGSAWEKNYHQQALDTSGNVNNATRHNFDVESHFFTGRSMIDITDTFAASTFAATATFAFTLTPSAKLSAARLTTSKQEQHATVFEVNDGANKLKLMWDNANGAGELALEGNTPPVVINPQATPVDGVAYRVVVTLTSSEGKLYLDGVLLGTLTLSGPLDWANIDGKLKAHIGAATHSSINNRFMVGDFYRGTMENVQCWNVAWDQTDVTNDMVDITSVIVSKPGANLISRFELTQSLVGMETKTTHVGDEALIDGITNKFADGTGTSYIAGEYYTVGVVDGILKDNATSFTHSGNWLDNSNTTTLTTITDSVGGAPIVPAISSVITEPTVLTYYHGARLSARVGAACGAATTSSFPGGASAQTSSGDMSCEFTIAQAGNGGSSIALSDETPSFGSSYYSTEYARGNMRFRFGMSANGTFQYSYIGSNFVSGISSWAIGDTFTLAREGASIRLYKHVLGVPTLVFTAAQAATQTLAFEVAFPAGMGSMHQMNITYEKAANQLAFGSIIGGTGMHDSNHLGLTTPIQIFADAVELDVVTIFNPQDFIAAPASGTCLVNLGSGTITFHDDEIGKTITGTCTHVTALQ